jgi:hypothetical protein
LLAIEAGVVIDAGIVDQQRHVGRGRRGLPDVIVAADIHLDRHQMIGCGQSGNIPRAGIDPGGAPCLEL